MDPDYSNQLAYREQLLRISEQMAAQDIEKLLWLLKKVIPLSKAEKISKGYQLFDELEKQRLLGPNNGNTVCKCLSAIGRQDLIKLLTTAVIPNDTSRALTTHAPIICSMVTPMSTCMEDFSYRKQLLQISDHLSSEDVGTLLWLLKNVIPQSRAEKITEGYQLFDELEKCGYLSPSSLTFLRMHLLVANREDLACKLETATHAPIPRIPSTFVTTHYTQVFRMKTTECMSKMKSLAHIGSAQAGKEWEMLRKMICNAGQEIAYAAEMDIPAEWWKVTATPALIDEVVQNTLQSTFAFAKTIFPCYYEPIPPNWDQIWQLSYQNYKTFDEELDRAHVEWNTCVRKKIRKIIDHRKHPHGVLASYICDYVRSICVDLLQDKEIETELRRVDDSLFTWESTWYIRWQNAALFHWISNLLHLAHSSIIDLSRHRELILRLFREHKDYICQSLEDITIVVGKDILDKLSPVLELLQCKPECFSPDSSQKFVLKCIPVLWCILLMELVALAEGHHIDPHEIGKATVHRLINYSSGVIIKTNAKMLQTAADRMYAEVLTLWKNAAKVANGSHYDVPMQDLFPSSTCWSTH